MVLSMRVRAGDVQSTVKKLQQQLHKKATLRLPFRAEAAARARNCILYNDLYVNNLPRIQIAASLTAHSHAHCTKHTQTSMAAVVRCRSARPRTAGPSYRKSIICRISLQPSSGAAAAAAAVAALALWAPIDAARAEEEVQLPAAAAAVAEAMRGMNGAF